MFWRWSSCFYCDPLILWWQITVHAMGVPVPPITHMICPIYEHIQNLERTTPTGSSFQMSRAWAFHQNHLSAFVGSLVQSLCFPESFILWHQCLRLTANSSSFGLFLRSAAYLPLFGFGDQLLNYDLMAESHCVAKHELCWAFDSSMGALAR